MYKPVDYCNNFIMLQLKVINSDLCIRKGFMQIQIPSNIMKTYISLSGFDASQILSLIVKYGIESDDRIVLIRPQNENDNRGNNIIEAVRDLSRQISSNIKVEVHRVDHHDYESMILSLTNLIKNTEGELIVNISGGPREIFLAFTVACLSQSQKINKTTNYSDIDRTMNEIALPNMTQNIDLKLRRVLNDVHENQPTTISEIASRLKLSESTVSRQIGKLAELKSLDFLPKGKSKQISMNLTGELFLLNN